MKPSLCDMVLLPSSVLRLLDIFTSNSCNINESTDGKIFSTFFLKLTHSIKSALFSETLNEIREVAEKHGHVSDVSRQGSHAFIEFEEVLQI